MHFDGPLAALAEQIEKGETDPVQVAKFFNAERADPSGKRGKGRSDLPTVMLNDGGEAELADCSQPNDQ